MAERGMAYTWSETGSVHRHSGLYSRHSRNYVESVSMEVCSVMTRLGYGEEMRRWRAKKYSELDTLGKRPQTAQSMSFTRITAGSKAEGLTCHLESDHDLLYVIDYVLCVEAGINIHTIPDDIDVFRMNTRAYPGHCRLMQERQAHLRWNTIRNALIYDEYGDIILSSGLFLDDFAAHAFTNPLHVFSERAGPSLPTVCQGVLRADRVTSLRCHCPSILKRWAARPRHWPSSVIVQKVVSLEAYLTPVGFKGSKYKHMEWRICFNTGETELVNNLNDTQAKVYVILKMILKDIVKPNKKEITSYVLKNIILWQAENNPQTEFHPRSLLHWLHDGLRKLRTAIEKNHLCYYMIPDRNLMAACGLDGAMQRKWIKDITDMLEEGPRVILRLEKIRKVIVASPEPMLWFSKKRMELEMIELESTNMFWKCLDANRNIFDSDWIILIRRKTEILREVRQRMHLEFSSVNDVVDILKRVLM